MATSINLSAKSECPKERLDRSHRTERVRRTIASRASKPAKLARAFPAREEVLVELHELRRRRQGLFLARQLEDRVAADDLGSELELENRKIFCGKPWLLPA